MYINYILTKSEVFTGNIKLRPCCTIKSWNTFAIEDIQKVVLHTMYHENKFV